MIAWLEGKVLSVDLEKAVVNVNGVGYEVAAPTSTLSELKLADSVQLSIYTHVREDQIALFGFLTPLEKALFESLLGVNGVGPKLAIRILSAAPVRSIAQAIEQSDVAFLSKLPKVGQKTANQLIVSLKGKLQAVLDSMPVSAAQAQGQTALGKSKAALASAAALSRVAHYSGHELEIFQALQNLGFREAELADHLDEIFNVATDQKSEGKDPVEAGLRYALRRLGGRV